MRALIRAIDKFSLTHRRFGIRRLMLYIVIGYGVIYLIAMLDTTRTFLSLISFDPARIAEGQVWRVITWVFYPTGGLLYLALMLYFSYFVGNSLEREWGTPKFTIFYFLGIILSVLYGFLIWLITGITVPLISDYLNLSLIFAYATLFPNQTFLLFFILPLKAKWLALFVGAYYTILMFVSFFGGQYFYALLPLVAVLNFFLFCRDDLIHVLRPYQARNTKQAINFRKAARRIQHEDAARPYRHKCAVCGKTDTDNPNLEFRYCSRCNGYHCFCIDHINSHVHFQ